MRVQILRSNEAAGLPINAVQRSGCRMACSGIVKVSVRLTTAASQLTMAAPKSDDLNPSRTKIAATLRPDTS